MINFDAEPEDAWDAGDTVEQQLGNLIRRMQLLDGQHRTGYPRDSPAETLDALEDQLRRLQRKRLYGRELERARQIEEDIEFIRGRC